MSLSVEAECSLRDLQFEKKAIKQNNQKFSRVFRLTCTHEFSSVFDARRTLKSAHFVLHYRPQNLNKPVVIGAHDQAQKPSSEQANFQHQVQHKPATTARLGLVVPKRLLKKSVHRNLVKRLGREQFRLLRQSLPKVDIVLRLNRAIPTQTIERAPITAEIKTLLEKLARTMSRNKGYA